MDRNEEIRFLLEDNHGGHRDRLRRRVQFAGLDSLKPHEALEFLLSYIIPRQDVNDLAHALIESFGTVDDVLHAEAPELMRVDGMGKRTAEWLCWVGESVDAFTHLKASDGVVLNTGLKTMRHGLLLRRGVEVPGTWQLCLNRDYHLMFQREICPSRAWGEPLIMRDALNDVLNMKAKHVILIQFTGRDLPRPDQYDVDHARGYGGTLRLAGCDLVDILFINDYDCVSMCQEGMFPDYKERDIFGRRRRNVSEEPEQYLYNMKENRENAPDAD